MESLLTTQLKQEGVHVYVAKVKPFMKLKTDEGKDYYDLWFILYFGLGGQERIHKRVK